MPAYNPTILATGGLRDFYPCNESAGGTSLADAGPGASNLPVTTGVVTLGATGLLVDGETAASFPGNASTSNGSFVWPFGLDWTHEVWLATTNAGLLVYFIENTDISFWFGVQGGFPTIGGAHTASVSVADGNRHHVVWTLTTGGVLTCYVDGTQAGQWSGVSGPTDNGNTGCSFGSFGAGSSGWNGRLAKFAVYGVALSGATVAAHFALGTTVPRTTLPVTDPHLDFSPAHWYDPGDGSYRQSINNDADAAGGVTGTTYAAFAIDLSMIPGGTGAANFPRVATRLNNGEWSAPAQLASGQTAVVVGASLSTGATYKPQMKVIAVDAYVPRWGGGNGVRVTGLTIDAAGSSAPIPSQYAAPTSVFLSFGDSTIEGGWTLGAPFSGATPTYALGADSRLVFVQGLAAGYGMRCVNVSFGGQDCAGGLFNSDIPSAELTVDKFFGGHGRAGPAGKLPFTVGAMFFEFGANGCASANVQAALAKLRAMCPDPTTPIIASVAADGGGRAGMTAGYNAYLAASGDRYCYLIDSGNLSESGEFSDGSIHQNVYGQLARAGKVQRAIGGVLPQPLNQATAFAALLAALAAVNPNTAATGSAAATLGQLQFDPTAGVLKAVPATVQGQVIPVYDGPIGLTVQPFASTISLPQVVTTNFTITQYSQPPARWTIKDSFGNLVNLTGKTVRLEVFTDDGVSDTGVFAYDTAGLGHIALSGTNNSDVTASFQTADTSTAAVYVYELWNMTDMIPLAKGTLAVERSRITVP